MKTVLVTGAAGSLGKCIVERLIKCGFKVRAFDNNEAGLASLRYDPKVFTRIYGDIRDYTRVNYAMMGSNIVIHTAAMKNLDITEGDVPELNKTNVIGTENIAKAAIECGLECAIFISTDKAVLPSSAYGASKLLGEWIWKWASKTQDRTRFAIFRSGNFMQSAGNVFEVWAKQYSAGESLTVTDIDMRRYFIDTKRAASIVCNMPDWVANGDIVIPVMKLYKMIDLMKEFYPNCKYTVIGSRPGEKLAERLMTTDEEVTYNGYNFQVIA